MDSDISNWVPEDWAQPLLNIVQFIGEGKRELAQPHPPKRKLRNSISRNGIAQK